MSTAQRERVIPNTEHPAKWSKPILDLVARLVAEETARMGRRLRLLDPMSGVGRIHDLDADTVSADLELGWAACRRPTVQANALHPPWRPGCWDVVATSVAYGNRMADNHVPKDKHKACAGAGCRGCKGSGLSPRKTYRVANGGPLHPDNAGQLQYGPRYQALHERFYATLPDLLAPGGMAIVNASDFIRDGEVVLVVEWTRRALLAAGLVFVDQWAVPTRRFRDGANRDARVPHEHVIVARNGA